MDGEVKNEWERYSRQMLFAPIGREGQEHLLKSRVAVIGLGALGSVSSLCLTGAGVGFLKLVDRDFVEESNLQRQILFNEDDAAKNLPKALAAETKLKKINSSLEYKTYVEDLNYTNIDEIIGDVDLVLDATDNFETRFLINEACVKNNIPWIYGACVGSSGITFTIIPGETACLACFLGVLPPDGTGDTCDTAGIISPIVNVVASVQAAEAMKILTGNGEALHKKAQFFDLWDSNFSEIEVTRNSNCSICVNHSFQFLSGSLKQRSSFLCGRDAVQILPSHSKNLQLEKISAKLSQLGEVHTNDFLVKFITGKYEMIIFQDGRALIKGTNDEKIARALYARYVGA